MKDLLVSFIVPVYNVEQYLNQCVESILSQSYTNFEIILIDDGSADQSGSLCDILSRRDNRIRVVHKTNEGASVARNYGLELSKGEYIIYLDSDDYWDDCDALGKIVGSLKLSEVDLITFGYKKKIEETQKIIYSLKSLDFDTSSLDISELMKYGLYCSSPCVKMIKKSFLLDNKILFRPNVASEDIEWATKILLNTSNIQYINVFPYVYRQRKYSTTSSMTEASIKDLQENLIRCFCLCEEAVKNGNKRYKVTKSFLAYQYTTFFFAIHNVKKCRYNWMLSMLKYKDVLDYSENRRIVFVRRVIKLLGFRMSYYLIRFYWKFFRYYKQL